jgi:hypothetical protein
MAALAIAGCSDPAAGPVAHYSKEGDAYEVAVTAPAAGGEIPIGRTFEIVAEVVNTAGGGPPLNVSGNVERDGTSYGGFGLEFVENGQQPTANRFRFTGKVRIPESSPEGSYLIRSEAIAIWEEPPKQEGAVPPEPTMKRFKAEDVRVVARKAAE